MARMPVAERRAKLVDAAIAAMARDGVPHTTTRSIVAEAGMPIGVFHYCFRSKEELVLEVMRTINERSYGAVAEVLTRSTDSATLIRLAVDAYWSHIESDPLEHLLTYELTQYALRQPGQGDAAKQQYVNYDVSMQQLLGAVAQVGGFEWSTPMPVLARFVLAIIEGVTFQWLVDRDGERARLLLDQLVLHLHRDAGLA